MMAKKATEQWALDAIFRRISIVKSHYRVVAFVMDLLVCVTALTNSAVGFNRLKNVDKWFANDARPVNSL